MKLTKKDIEDGIELVKQFNIKISFIKLNTYGNACAKKRLIRIDTGVLQKSFEIFYSVLFHELSHILCYDHKKYYKYHYLTSFKNKFTREEIKIIRKTGLKAEKYCDIMGEKFFKSFFPNLQCSKYYFPHPHDIESNWVTEKDIKNHYKNSYLDLWFALEKKC